MIDKDENASRGRPDPDPTVLTTDALNREVAYLKEYVDTRIECLREFIDERFNSIDDKFLAVEKARVEQKNDTKAAVDAALIAQKEAVKEQTLASEKSIFKSESQFDKRYDATDKTVDELKERVGSIEAGRQGGNDMRVAIFATIAIFITIFTVLAATGVFK